MREALHYSMRGQTAHCALCPKGCAIAPGRAGACLARENRDGKLYAASYGRATGLALDPIEKKPLYRFHPGSRILSVGSYGCNLRCAFCQNDSISMLVAPYEEISPDALAVLAARAKAKGNIGVAYTYNEPLVGYEYVLDCAKQIRAAGMVNVLVTNGFINPKPLAALLPHMDALNIDLKGFTPAFYAWVGGDLSVVQHTIRQAAKACHVEVATPVIPGRNDSPDEMAAQCDFLADISPDLPLHINRFFPRHRMRDAAPTPLETLYCLARIAKRRLRHVYVGNV